MRYDEKKKSASFKEKMPRKNTKNITKKSALKPIAKKAEVKVLENKRNSPNTLIAGIQKNWIAFLVATIIVLAGVYVILPGRYHFLGDVPKATAQHGVTYQGVNGQNALSLLEADHRVKTTSFGSLGEFVTSIDGVTANKNQYWAFYVNGKASSVGASSYITKNSDTLSWKLQSL